MVHSLSAPAGRGEAIVHLKPEVEKVVVKTVGVPLFQEQATRQAVNTNPAVMS
jgi:predicted ATPase